jgi:hypothetical protein
VIPASRRWLEHAIAPGAAPATSLRLSMHGAIRLGRWRDFTATETIEWPRGFDWRASLRLFGLPVRGFDRLEDGRALMRWRLLGVIPLMQAGGHEVARSMAGRLAAELIWLPSVLAGPGVAWTERGDAVAEARLTVADEPVVLELAVDPDGRLGRVRLERWGNPGGGPFRRLDFGARIEEERRFGAFTIPSRLRVGWHVDSDRFEADGEFFRATIDHAEFGA